MQFTQSIILKALYCVAGAATFWQVLLGWLTNGPPFCLFTFETLVQNSGAVWSYFGFISHSLFHFPFLKADESLEDDFSWQWDHVSFGLSNHLSQSSRNLQHVDLKQLQPVSFLMNSARSEIHRFHEIRYTKFFTPIKLFIIKSLHIQVYLNF